MKIHLLFQSWKISNEICLHNGSLNSLKPSYMLSFTGHIFPQTRSLICLFYLFIFGQVVKYQKLPAWLYSAELTILMYLLNCAKLFDVSPMFVFVEFSPDAIQAVTCDAFAP